MQDHERKPPVQRVADETIRKNMRVLPWEWSDKVLMFGIVGFAIANLLLLAATIL